MTPMRSPRVRLRSATRPSTYQSPTLLARVIGVHTSLQSVLFLTNIVKVEYTVVYLVELGEMRGIDGFVAEHAIDGEILLGLERTLAATTTITTTTTTKVRRKIGFAQCQSQCGPVRACRASATRPPSCASEAGSCGPRRSTSCSAICGHSGSCPWMIGGGVLTQWSRSLRSRGSSSPA